MPPLRNTGEQCAWSESPQRPDQCRRELRNRAAGRSLGRGAGSFRSKQTRRRRRRYRWTFNEPGGRRSRPSIEGRTGRSVQSFKNRRRALCAQLYNSCSGHTGMGTDCTCSSPFNRQLIRYGTLLLHRIQDSTSQCQSEAPPYHYVVYTTLFPRGPATVPKFAPKASRP